MSFLCEWEGEGSCYSDFYSVVAKLSKQAGKSKQQMMKNCWFFVFFFFGKLRIVKCYDDLNFL